MPPEPKFDLSHKLEVDRLRAARFYEANKKKISDQRKARRLAQKEQNQPVETPTKPVETPKKTVEIPKKTVETPKKTELTFDYCVEKMNKMTKTGTEIQLAESTKQKLIKNLKQLFLLYGKPDIYELLINPEKLEILMEKATQGYANRADIILCILKLLNIFIIPNYPQKLYSKINLLWMKYEKLKKQNIEAKITSTEHEVEKIEDVQQKIKEKYGINSKESIVFNLYVEATKRDDFGKIKIVPSINNCNTTDNYIIIPKKGVVNVYIQQHKTQQKYTPEQEPLSIELSNSIRTYIKTNNIKENLFTESKMASFLKKTMKNIGFDKITGSTAIRHLIVANTFRNENLTVEQATTLSKKMKHKPATQLEYIREVKK
jgi:hypothetical protein